MSTPLYRTDPPVGLPRAAGPLAPERPAQPVSPLPPDQAPTRDPAEDRHVQACVHYLSALVARLCASPQLQTAWTLSLPLDPELLASTRLQLSYCPMEMWLEFRTSDWAVREFLRPHLPRFRAELQQRMPPACAVQVTLR